MRFAVHRPGIPDASPRSHGVPRRGSACLSQTYSIIAHREGRRRRFIVGLKAAVSSRALMTEVVIYTDGACSGNPGPGGWGVVLRWKDTEKELYGGDPLTTNNRMELMAAIQALEALQRPAKVDLYTDSKYLLDGITKWIKGWQRNGWLTSAKKPVKNDDLWRRLSEAMSRHEVTWLWVKGHAGDPGNERADALARRGIEEAATMVRSGQ